MLSMAVRVDPDDPTDFLHSQSRLNYTKMYSIEYNVKAKSVGMVNRASLPSLLVQTRLVRERMFGDTPQQSAALQSHEVFT